MKGRGAWKLVERKTHAEVLKVKVCEIVAFAIRTIFCCRMKVLSFNKLAAVSYRMVLTAKV
jgi:hypothetical protein